MTMLSTFGSNHCLTLMDRQIHHQYLLLLSRMMMLMIMC